MLGERAPALAWRGLSRNAVEESLDLGHVEACLLRQMNHPEHLDGRWIIAAPPVDTPGGGQQANALVVAQRRSAHACAPRDLADGQFFIHDYSLLTSSVLEIV